MRAQLVPIESGTPLDITKDMTVLGRGEECDVRLEHKSISKMHCVIVKTDGLLLLRDLGSTNGTRVNGQRVRRAALLPNDQLAIASLRFKVLFGPKWLPDASPDEQTQKIEAKELEDALKNRPVTGDSEVDIAQISVQLNQLPDVYPVEAAKK